jgi:uncharacterized protein YndB with AHSA1/START domain
MANVEQTIQIDAPAEKVWRLAGDPGRIADWMPALSTSTVVGDRRSCGLAQGGQIEERILEHSDDERRYRYEIREGPMPLRTYVSSLSVDGQDGSTQVRWVADFEPEDPAQEDEVAQTFQQLYAQGLQALKAKVEGS